jgi:hypothetical protein
MTADADTPLPKNVHRYYFPGVTHGGGGGFTYVANPPPATGCTRPANPNPISDANDVLQDDFIALIMSGTPMPPDVYPRCEIVPALSPGAAEGGCDRIPQHPGISGPGVYHPLLKYDFGPLSEHMDQKGIVTVQPPVIDKVLPTYVVRVNSYGNEPDEPVGRWGCSRYRSREPGSIPRYTRPPIGYHSGAIVTVWPTTCRSRQHSARRLSRLKEVLPPWR